MEYKDLRALLALASTSHMGQAAAQLHMSPSSLSRRLARMEQEMGTLLFDRQASPMVLTRAGALLLNHAEQTLDDWDRIRREVDERVSDLSGSLTLFCSVTASYSLLPDLLSRFRQRYPNVDLNILTGDVAESIPRVVSGAADMVVAARPEVLDSGLVFGSLVTSPLLFIAPKSSGMIPGLRGGEPQWQQIPMVLSTTGLARTRVDQWFEARGATPHVYAQVSGSEAIVSMVALGVGVGVVPELVLKTSPVASRVRVLDIEPKLEPFSVGVCAYSDRLQEPLVEALWKTAFSS
ncbi:MAG: HTH-type transcriptional activator IlvY [Oceanobacter sp.]